MSDSKTLARALVAEIAPDELDLFEQVWDDHTEHPDRPLDGGRSPFGAVGAGGAAESINWISILIPIATTLATHAATRGIDWIIDELKTRTRGKVKSDEIERLAREISKILEQHAANRR